MSENEERNDRFIESALNDTDPSAAERQIAEPASPQVVAPRPSASPKAPAPEPSAPPAKKSRPLPAPVVLPTPKGWRGQSIALFGVVFVLLALPLTVFSLVSSLRGLTVHLSTHPTWSMRSLRDSEDLKGAEFVKRSTCYTPVPSGRLLARTNGVVDETHEVPPTKPYVAAETPRADRRALEREIEALKDGSLHLDKTTEQVTKKCFDLTANGRLIDPLARIELVEFGSVADSDSGASGAIGLIALFILAGLVPVFLTPRATWPVVFLASGAAALLQALLWLSQVRWGDNGILMRSIAFGAASIPAALFISLFLLVLVSVGTLFNSLGTTLRFAVMGATHCGKCQAVFTSVVAPSVCPSCKKDLPRTRLRTVVALGTAIASTLLLAAFTVLAGPMLGFYERCKTGDPGGTCAYFTRQHGGVTVSDFGTGIVVYDGTLYLLFTAIAFVPAPLLVARLLPSGRSTALLGAALAWLPASVAGAFLLSPSSDTSLLGSLFIFHFKALAPWIIPGLIGAFAGYAWRMRNESALSADLAADLPSTD